MNGLVSDPLRITVVGGGTGSYNVLRGLKSYAVELAAIVSVLDDGGSSGRLRDEFGHLPPGDVRRCLLALAPDDDAHRVLRQLFDYRFDKGDGLNGHSFGNLFLTALAEIGGGLEGAIQSATHLLNARGEVIPVTLADSRLCAVLTDGTRVRGECNLDVRTVRPEVPIERVYVDPPADANPRALAALARADAIVIGPGDLYTSVMPNLVVGGVPEAIRSANAPVIYVSNLMTKHGETDGYTAGRMAAVVRDALGLRRLDAVVASGDQFDPALLERYQAERSEPVAVDRHRLQMIAEYLHLEPLAMRADVARHDPQRLAHALMQTFGALLRLRAAPLPILN